MFWPEPSSTFSYLITSCYWRCQISRSGDSFLIKVHMKTKLHISQISRLSPAPEGSSLLPLCSLGVCSTGRMKSSAVVGSPGYRDTSSWSSGTPDTCSHGTKQQTKSLGSLLSPELQVWAVASDSVPRLTFQLQLQLGLTQVWTLSSQVNHKKEQTSHMDP